jgi:hypothetical protein
MKPDVMLRELEATAEQLAVKVTYEALQASIGIGGLCRVKGSYRVIIDKRSSTGDRVATLAQALAGFDHAELDLSRPVRELLAHYALRRAS